MYGVAAFGTNHAVALDGLDEDYRRLVGIVDGAMVGGINLDGVLSTPLDLFHLGIGERVHHLLEFGISIDPVLPLPFPRQYGIALVITVHTFFHASSQGAVHVLGQQLVPAAAPDHLDHIPAGADEGGFQFLNDLAITPHRAVETLQIAVHHQNQIIQLFSRCDVNAAQYFRLIGLPIADETPYLAA